MHLRGFPDSHVSDKLESPPECRRKRIFKKDGWVLILLFPVVADFGFHATHVSVFSCPLVEIVLDTLCLGAVSSSWLPYLCCSPVQVKVSFNG